MCIEPLAEPVLCLCLKYIGSMSAPSLHIESTDFLHMYTCNV